ncbi:uncharacterized protein LOC144439835 [Glandiceps talaboti]
MYLAPCIVLFAVVFASSNSTATATTITDKQPLQPPPTADPARCPSNHYEYVLSKRVRVCRQCRQCPDGVKVLSPCNLTADTLCRGCVDGNDFYDEVTKLCLYIPQHRSEKKTTSDVSLDSESSSFSEIILVSAAYFGLVLITSLGLCFLIWFGNKIAGQLRKEEKPPVYTVQGVNLLHRVPPYPCDTASLCSTCVTDIDIDDPTTCSTRLSTVTC